MIRRLAALALAAAVAQPAAAEAPRIGAQPVADVALLAGWRQPDGSRMAALEIRLAPGWHTYWRVPGNSGIPPSFDWGESENLADIAIEWPRPELFDGPTGPSIGYADRLVLPVLLTPADPALPIGVALDLFFGVCADICIPAEAGIEKQLPPDAAPHGRAAIEAALREGARSPAEAGVTAVSCAVRPDGEGLDLTATVTFDHAPPADLVAVIEVANPDVWIGAPRTRTSGDTLTAAARLEHYGEGAMLLDRSELRLTLLDPARMVDIRGCPAP
jgi:DsbC/DsbD-like thiol-disulfide interchange protein